MPPPRAPEGFSRANDVVFRRPAAEREPDRTEGVLGRNAHRKDDGRRALTSLVAGRARRRRDLGCALQHGGTGHPGNRTLSVFGSRESRWPFRASPEPPPARRLQRRSRSVRMRSTVTARSRVTSSHATPRPTIAGDVLGARAETALVARADHHRLQQRAAPDVERADALRRVELVAGDGQQIHREIPVRTGTLPMDCAASVWTNAPAAGRARRVPRRAAARRSRCSSASP